jgi:hypothetical protein
MDGLVDKFRALFPDRPAPHTVPLIALYGYHPDAIYAFHHGSLMVGRQSVWTSRIILGAFLSGLTVDACEQLFSEEFFERLGYFDLHEPSVRSQVERFAQVGLDGRWWLDRVSALGNFLHSPNHPHPAGIGLLAFQVATALELPIERRAPFDLASFWNTYLADHLRVSIWPVYPEVADRLGVDGGYLFKDGDDFYELREFIARRYSAWSEASLDRSAITTHPADALSQFDAALEGRRSIFVPHTTSQ